MKTKETVYKKHTKKELESAFIFFRDNNRRIQKYLHSIEDRSRYHMVNSNIKQNVPIIETVDVLFRIKMNHGSSDYRMSYSKRKSITSQYYKVYLFLTKLEKEEYVLNIY